MDDCDPMKIDDSEGLLQIDGFDEALMGVCNTWAGGHQPRRLVYHGPTMVELLMEQEGMSEEDAYEYVSYNCEGWYLGPSTPIVVWDYHGEDH